MASQTKRKHSKAYNTEELFDLVDNLGNNNKKEEGFDKIRQWLNTNKDDNAKLKEAMIHRGQGGCNTSSCNRTKKSST
jgi:hypothetical protein